jgi:hypothetical protein
MMQRAYSFILSARRRWHAPVPAIPIDVFRVLVGVLSTVYFAHLAIQTADFSSPNGLIDHRFVREVFWYTRLGLFRPGISAFQFQLIFIGAAAASLALAAGWKPKLMAAFMFIIAVSAYRWNFLVIYVDDGIMHLAIFWILLLPVGRTLVLAELVSDRYVAVDRWRRTLVSGGAVRAFLVSLSLVYIVAGMWKWTSPMWRSGTALFAALQTPIAWAPGLWTPEQLPVIAGADYATLFLEPVFPLMFVLKRNNPVKWALLAMMVGFHLGIIATMKVPYANIACLAAIPVIFRDELMRLVNRRRSYAPLEVPTYANRICAVGSTAFVIVLTLAMMGEAAVPDWRAPNRAEERTTNVEKVSKHAGFLGTQHNPMYLPLWAIGIAQSYRLFDWIDDRNFRVRYDVSEIRADGSRRIVDPDELFPTSIRGVLLQTYLHDVTWGSVPRERGDELKLSLFARFAHRYCRSSHAPGDIVALATVGRVAVEGPVPLPPPAPFLRFSCDGSVARLAYARLDRDRMATFPSARVNAALMASTPR